MEALAKIVAWFMLLLFIIFVAFMALVAFNPLAVYLPGWFLDQWRDPCNNDPVATYLEYSHCRKHGPSPITSANANDRLKASGYCPLRFAALGGNVEGVNELLGKGADPKLCEGYPDTFYDAALGGSLRCNPSNGKKMFLLLAREGIFPTDPQRFLYKSAEAECALGIRLAVERGASVNTPDASGNYPLHYVVKYASIPGIETARVLVELGANPHLPGPNGESALVEGKRRLSSLLNWRYMEEALLGLPSSMSSRRSKQ